MTYMDQVTRLSASEIACERKGAVLVITTSQPQVRNALDQRSTRALTDAFRGVAEDPACRAVVLNGAATFFCAGADVYPEVPDRAGAQAATKRLFGPDQAIDAALRREEPWQVALLESTDHRVAREGRTNGSHFSFAGLRDLSWAPVNGRGI